MIIEDSESGVQFQDLKEGNMFKKFGYLALFLKTETIQGYNYNSVDLLSGTYYSIPVMDFVRPVDVRFSIGENTGWQA